MTARPDSFLDVRPVARGVHIAPYRDHGRPVAIAVDRHGNKIDEAVIHDRSGAQAVLDIMWDRLDEADPPWPRLTLI